MSKEYHLTFPIAEEDIRKLEVGDVVYLSGTIHTMRDMGHARALKMLDAGEKLPFDLASSCIWHAAPIVKQREDGRWEICSIGSTTSSRFTPLGSRIIRALNMRVTVGKGTMGPEAMEAMRQTGSVYLNTTGGCAALYGERIKEVETVHWLDLGLPEAIWVMRAEELGPLIVGIDSHGASLYKNMEKAMADRVIQEAENLGVDLNHNYAYMPKSVVGRPRPVK